MINQPLQQFVDSMLEQGITRFHFVYDPQTKHMQASHPQLQSIADFIAEDTRDFHAHEGLFFEINPEFKTLQGAFVHRTNRGQGSGGMRYWQYDTVEDFLRDGLRLSKGMTRKNALAGLWWGGGKGIIAHNPDVDRYDPEVRQRVYQDYGRFVTNLRGCYITAEDVGTLESDMADIFANTRFATCIPQFLGGSGNPSPATALGVVTGMEAALDFLSMNDLKDKTIVIQGVGNVGGFLVEYLLEKGVKKIIGSDIHVECVDEVRKRFNTDRLEVRLTEIGDNTILSEACDILAPCAIGGILNPTTIPNIKAKIVCGAANNQLEDSVRDDALLFEQGIVYVPDFLVNRMGIVNCANEQYGHVNDDILIQQHFSRDWQHSIWKTTQAVLAQSQREQQPTAKVAIALADELALQPHPIFGHRGRQIVDSLVEDRWFEAK